MAANIPGTVSKIILDIILLFDNIEQSWHDLQKKLLGQS